MQKCLTIVFILLFFLKWEALAQPGTYYLTPKVPLRHDDFRGGMGIQKINVAPKFLGLFDSSLTLLAPKCYSLHLFYVGKLKNPAGLEFNNNVLHVIDYDSNGAIYALPAIKLVNFYEDFADTIIKVLDGVNGHSFKFYQGNIYVAEQNRILKCLDLDKDGFYETKEAIINGIDWPAITPGKFNRSIAIDSIEQRIYVSIGASCNACREDVAGRIESYNLNGGDKQIIATGIRNGMAMVVTEYFPNKLWVANQGNTGQGDTIPPDWIDDVLQNENGFYGHPFAYGYQNWFNFDSLTEFAALKPITIADSVLVKKMHHPAGLLPAHSVPLDGDLAHVVNVGNSNEIIITLLGDSITRNSGTKVISVNHQNAKIYSYSDLLTGFLVDTATGTFWGKPTGVAIQNKHLITSDIFISSSEGYKCIIKLTGQCHILGLEENSKQTFKIFPNPFTDCLKFDPQLPPQAILHLSNVNGKEIVKLEVGYMTETKLPTLPIGVYFLRIETNEGVIHKMIYKSND